MKTLVLILFAVTATVAQTRTITNEDLEKFRQERLRAEDDYRRNYARRGLPSPEELEKLREQRVRELEEYSQQLRSRRESAEAAIIERANLLRSQLASINSQIAYLQGIRGKTFQQPATYWSFGYQNYGFRRPRWDRQAEAQKLPPNLQTVTDLSRMYPNSSDVYNRASGNYGPVNERPRGGFYGGGYLYPVMLSVGNSNEADSQLLYLNQVRAGLLAEWEILEEDARVAGVRLD